MLKLLIDEMTNINEHSYAKLRFKFEAIDNVRWRIRWIDLAAMRAVGSGVTMEWADRAKSRKPPSAGVRRSRKFKKNNFSVTVKIRTRGYQTP